MDIDVIKEKIAELHRNDEEICVEVHSKNPKINVDHAPARITGVYKNLFTLEVIENGLKKIYSVQYTDLFIGKVKIDKIEKQSE